MGLQKHLQVVLSIFQILFSLIALATSAADRAKGDEDSSIKLLIAVATFSFLLGIMLLSMALVSQGKAASIVGLLAGAFSIVAWIAALAHSGAQDPEQFHASNYCGESAGDSKYDLCSIYRLRVSAWVFGFFCLLLWLASLTVASMGVLTNSKILSTSSGKAQPMHPIHGQPHAANTMPL